MAKGKKSVFFCQNCGHEENKWLGQCPMCKEWNTFVEEPVSFSKSASAKLIKDAEVVALKHVETDQEERIKTKIEELDESTWRRNCSRVSFAGGRRSWDWEIYPSFAGVSETV